MIELALIALSLLCVVLAGVAVWLAVDRARRASALASAERDAARAASLSEQLDIERSRVGELERDVAALEERLKHTDAAREREVAALREAERRHREELERRLDAASKQLKDAFAASAQDAVDKSTERLVAMANQQFGKQHATQTQSLKELVGPIAETLKRTDEKIGQLEKQRIDTQSTLREQIEQLGTRSALLGEETRKLTQALRKPQVRGRYGEVQLERVAELAGMTSYCDFATQASVTGEDGVRRRPDMVVSLPNGREIAVDAKTNIEPYMDALEAEDDDERGRHMERFAEGVLTQARALAAKRYWADYAGSPEFCVMFIPGDQFIDAALERRPTLLDLAAQESVLLASPSTLIGLLRAVAVGWREKNLSDAAQELFQLGRELHERAAIVMEHAADVGKHLDKTMRSYNKLVGSMDTRLTPTLRRFEEAGASSAKRAAELKPVETTPREPAALPFNRGGGDDGEADADAGM